jgi:hypothetical protein
LGLVEAHIIRLSLCIDPIRYNVRPHCGCVAFAQSVEILLADSPKRVDEVGERAFLLEYEAMLHLKLHPLIMRGVSLSRCNVLLQKPMLDVFCIEDSLRVGGGAHDERGSHE